MISTPYSHYNE